MISSVAGAQEIPDQDLTLFDSEFAAEDMAPLPHEHPDEAVDLTALDPLVEPATGDVLEYLGSGHASYYGRRFAGRPTASGETFDPKLFTAAHRTLPFGSLVRVTNPRNGRSVIVRINDRGPFVKGREIDISRAAAEEIGLVRRGVAMVELELIQQ